jgi:hypothetical protein
MKMGKQNNSQYDAEHSALSYAANNPLLPHYPQRELLYVIQNLGAVATTHGCSRQCSYCGVAPPKQIQAMPFWMVEALAPVSLRVIPYLMGEPFDYFDPGRTKDISDVVEVNYRFGSQTQITTAFWGLDNHIAANAAQKINIDHVDDFRVSVHLFWPPELLSRRKAEIVNGCRILWERGQRGLVCRVTCDESNHAQTEVFLAKLQNTFPGLFSESRTSFVPVVGVGRAYAHSAADKHGEVYFNKLVVFPSGKLSVFFRQGRHYRIQPTGVGLFDDYDADAFRAFQRIVRTYLAVRAEGYRQCREFLAALRSEKYYDDPELAKIVGSSRLDEVCTRFLEFSHTVPKMNRVVHKFCHDLFSFDEPEIQTMVSEVLRDGGQINDIEVVRRAVDFVLRTDRLVDFSEAVTKVVMKRVFGRGVIDGATGFEAPLLDVLGFMPQNRKLIDDTLVAVDAMASQDAAVQNKIRHNLIRARQRLRYLAYRQA